MKPIVPLLAAVFLGGSLAASPLTWHVTGAFDDGGTLSGSFVYDAITTNISSWNIQATGGNTATFPNITYATNASVLPFNGSQFAVFFDPASTRRLILQMTAPLPDAGGTIPLISFIDNTNFSGECFNCTPTRFLVDGGSLSAIRIDRVSSTPEPGSLAMLGAGGLVLFSRKRLSAWMRPGSLSVH
ncbi:MAG: PEP-CTERM sorting domain-containing protein [Bryobacteraceae bacterium]